ncbi:Cathepsin_B [Hexamita inflata]|uniref:Cathepsin B n=1 Tax=Hexamita inflata TaxID=28002 RepID=A0AA86V3E0_9EUKA|nr:Cathepsin B [Hexamita inflata]
MIYNHTFIEMLQNIPDLSWTPGVSEYFLDKQIQLSQSRYVNMLSQKTRYVGVPPTYFSWLDEKPECIQVDDIQSCGANWAFSSVGQFSENRCISGKDLTRVAYSEQYMISCDSKSHGCRGTASMFNPQNFLKITGVPTKKCVSYKSGSNGQQQKCAISCDDGSKINTFKSQSFEDVCTGEESIQNALTNGTIQTQFDVYTDFFYYTNGIYQHVSGNREGSEMATIVGFGEENNIKFWTVRNSWGKAWGENGYFRIVRGENHCQIEQQCFLTVV